MTSHTVQSAAHGEPQRYVDSPDIVLPAPARRGNQRATTSPVSVPKAMTIREITGQETLHPFLIQDRIAGAYFIGDLDPRYWPFCRWWGAEDDSGQLIAVVLLYTGLRMPAVLTLGDEMGVEAILADAAVQSELPARFYAHVMTPHLLALQERYHVDNMHQMLRMGLDKADFKPLEVAPCSVQGVSHRDTADLMDLYRYYPDNFFEPYQLESGYYFGVHINDHLVSVAGVHIFSEQYDIAAIGNIVTHPKHRAKGYSSCCTSFLLNKLFERVSLVALNVHKENAAAQRVYSRLGFHAHVRYLEGLVERR